MFDDYERLLNAKEVAERLSLREDYIYGKAAAGLMPSYRFGKLRRFKLAEVEAWLGLPPGSAPAADREHEQREQLAARLAGLADRVYRLRVELEDERPTDFYYACADLRRLEDDLVALRDGLTNTKEEA